MKKRILLTGATGYIGKRLLPVLVEMGHHVICCVRDPDRFNPPSSLLCHISIVRCDLLNIHSLNAVPDNIDGAFYLVHSMTNSKDYEQLEARSASNFVEVMNKTTVKHVIYLSGIANEETLSKHLSSRKNVEDILSNGRYHFTALRAGIIIGSGSASFEIIRDLVEKLPIMIAPKWLKTKCQPIGISDVIQFLSRTLFNDSTYDDNFDIGGPDILSYKNMLLGFAEVRKLKRWILTIPIMTPRLSSYWLYFVTSTSYNLATSLVDSMKVEVICRDNRLAQLLGIQAISYKESIRRAFKKIENNNIASSWKDAYISSGLETNVSDFIKVPSHGCFLDKRQFEVENRDECINRIWQIGGAKGWYYADFLWKFRGYLDKMVGGVGLRRGRTSPIHITVGDALDFWRVLYANKSEGRLLLYAEMKLPGEAWLEFRMDKNKLVQTATFRPLGVLGRLYWYSVLPFHEFVFKGMGNKLANG